MCALEPSDRWLAILNTHTLPLVAFDWRSEQKLNVQNNEVLVLMRIEHLLPGFRHFLAVNMKKHRHSLENVKRVKNALADSSVKVLSKCRAMSKFTKLITVVSIVMFLMLNVLRLASLNHNLLEELDQHRRVYKSSYNIGDEHGLLAFPDVDSTSSARPELLNLRNIRPEEENKFFTIDALSGKTVAGVVVDGKVVFDGNERGISIIILHPSTGKVMNRRTFDTYYGGEDDAIQAFLNKITMGRIVVFAVKDDGGFRLGKSARAYISSMGSRQIGKLSLRSMWAMVVQKGGDCLGESYSESAGFVWGTPVHLRVKAPVAFNQEGTVCNFKNDSKIDNARRREFCENFEGFENICDCDKPDQISFAPEEFPNNRIKNIPVAVIAGDRANYLNKMLRYLLTARGVNRDMITVYIDGYPKEVTFPSAVAKLYGVRAVSRTPPKGTVAADGSIRRTARVSQHYRHSLAHAFDANPRAEYLIVLEDDLQVAPDFFSYFSQTLRLLEEDKTLFCVSAWNDNAFNHSSMDPALLYRVDGMPGLGWMLRRSVFKGELEKIWPAPEEDWDWDMWVRHPSRLKGRECVIPDVPRTLHFGKSGVHVNAVFQEGYFTNKIVNEIPYVKLKDVDSLKKKNYEKLIEQIIKNGAILDHTKVPCVENVPFPDNYNDSSVIVSFIEVEKDDVSYKNWIGLAKCFKLWDLESRGTHNTMWRFSLFGKRSLVVGVPKSPYSKFMPAGIKPISYFRG